MAEDPLLILGYISVLVKLLVGNVLFFFFLPVANKHFCKILRNLGQQKAT